ncbi:hypothetical protein [Desulfopila sp. IMCC35008]|uniref:hypothetical protein n=1 Tax=Desulfopila sp. IMCC35008 TaxID=2653858 RepID=UPI0013D6E1DA|nr:hypothetical protein [Desulfopila sp. IMCC35008]
MKRSAVGAGDVYRNMSRKVPLSHVVGLNVISFLEAVLISSVLHLCYGAGKIEFHLGQSPVYKSECYRPIKMEDGLAECLCVQQNMGNGVG